MVFDGVNYKPALEDQLGNEGCSLEAMSFREDQSTMKCF
jgi:hypothetical protein